MQNPQGPSLNQKSLAYNNQEHLNLNGKKKIKRQQCQEFTDVQLSDKDLKTDIIKMLNKYL